MENNVLSAVKVQTSKRPRARFNLSYDVNTTCEWGFLQPFCNKFMIPNSKNVAQVEQLVRLAPMLAPTFGRVVGRQYHQFVECDDIWPAFSAFMAQKAYNGSGTSYVPQCVPRIPLAVLSLYALAGAKCSIYVSSAQNELDVDSKNVLLYNESRVSGNNTNVTQLWPQLLSFLTYGVNTNCTTNVGSTNAQPYFYRPYQGPVFNAMSLLNANIQSWLKGLSEHGAGSAILPTLFLPIGNPDKESFFHNMDVQDDSWYEGQHGLAGYDYSDVPLDSADMVIPASVPLDNNGNYKVCYFAFRFSSFGKRLRKVLLGLGYQLDVNTRSVVSLLPLMAYFKSYYDLFGITQHTNYQESHCARLSAYITANNESDIAKYFSVTSNANANKLAHYVSAFVCSLADCWYTETTDYISAHQSKTSYADAASGVTSNFISLNQNGSNINLTNTDGTNFPDTQPSITANPFSALDVELLQRLYRWSNVQSVAGKQIAAALRAQGFGSFVDECKSNFIGYDEQYVNISDVVSTSDTFKDGTGSILGEYGAKGIGYGQSKSFTFETDKFGYWISLMTIIPKSGYSQGLDQTLIDTEKFDFYNPDFDNLGYKLSERSVVTGNDDFVSWSDEIRSDSFGLIPQYFEWKVGKNIANGDFSLRGTKNTYQPYCLDKEIPVGERRVSDGVVTSGINGNIAYTVRKIFPLMNLATAGIVWRYLARYPWIGTFNRIFANFDASNLYNRLSKTVPDDVESDVLEYVTNDYDNFLIHCIVNYQSYAPMMPVEETFGTDDDGSFNGAIEKS